MIINILKKIGFLGVIMSSLVIIGNILNGVIDWTKLTDIFSTFRFFWNSLDWIINANLMITLIGTSFLLDIAENAFVAGMIPLDYFKKDKD